MVALLLKLVTLLYKYELKLLHLSVNPARRVVARKMTDYAESTSLTLTVRLADSTADQPTRPSPDDKEIKVYISMCIYYITNISEMLRIT